MKLKCWMFGHDWGQNTPWTQFTLNNEPPYDGDFMVIICKCCDKMMEVPGSRLGHGRMYVRREEYDEQQVD